MPSKAVERAPRGGGVRRLRVVDVADAADARRRARAGAGRPGRRQRGRDRRRRRSRPRAPRRSRRPRSRGCARPGSAARPAARRRRRTRSAALRPGPARSRRHDASRPPSGSRRSAASRRGSASKVPCRSRWSGSRLSRTAIRGRSSWTSSSWKLDSSQTTQAPARLSDELAQSACRRCPAVRRAEHRAEQLGRRRLPVRAGDADERVRQQREPRARSRSRPGSHARARRHERRLARHAGALDEHVDAVEQAEVGVVAERPVGRDDLHAARLERRLRRPPGARQPEHERPPHDSRNSR